MQFLKPNPLPMLIPASVIIKDAVTNLIEQLSCKYEKGEASAITEMLLEAVCGLNRMDLLVNPGKQFSGLEADKWNHDVAELLNDRPIQYVLGKTTFYGLALSVDESVLIPRPETEELADWVIRDAEAFSGKDLSILDIGTGSGCLALALKKSLPFAKVFAVDYAEETLKTAKENAERNKLEIELIQWDILNEMPPEFLKNMDILVSNPPYITFSEKEKMAPNVLNYEPGRALFVTNNDPLQFYKKIEELSKKILKSTGKTYLELNESFAGEVEDYFRKKGWQTLVKKDFQGKPRMIKIEGYSKS